MSSSPHPLIVGLQDKGVQLGIKGLTETTKNIKEGQKIGAFFELNSMFQGMIKAAGLSDPFKLMFSYIDSETAGNTAQSIAGMAQFLASDEGQSIVGFFAGLKNTMVETGQAATGLASAVAGIDLGLSDEKKASWRSSWESFLNLTISDWKAVYQDTFGFMLDEWKSFWELWWTTFKEGWLEIFNWFNNQTKKWADKGFFDFPIIGPTVGGGILP